MLRNVLLRRRGSHIHLLTVDEHRRSIGVKQRLECNGMAPRILLSTGVLALLVLVSGLGEEIMKLQRQFNITRSDLQQRQFNTRFPHFSYQKSKSYHQKHSISSKTIVYLKKNPTTPLCCC